MSMIVAVPVAVVMSMAVVMRRTVAGIVNMRVHCSLTHSTSMLRVAHHQLSTPYWKL